MAAASATSARTACRLALARCSITEIQGLERLFKTHAEEVAGSAAADAAPGGGYVELETAALPRQDRERIKARGRQEEEPAGAGQAPAQTRRRPTQIVKAARKKAIEYYTQMKNEYPNYSKLDEVLYYLAYEYEQASDLKNARKVYFELIQKAPKSQYIPNAYLAFGELFFNEAQGDPSKWDLAAAAYKEVIKYPPPNNKVFGYARYKLGYVHWNKGEFAEGAERVQEDDRVRRRSTRSCRTPSSSRSPRAATSSRSTRSRATRSKAFNFFKPLSGDTGRRTGQDVSR